MRHRDKDRKDAFMQLLEKEPVREPPCRHFKEGCGGCLMQQHAYGSQLKAKAQYLAQVYGVAVPVHAAKEELGYRNRMDFVTAFGKNGLRKRGKYAHVVDIKDCLLLPEKERELHRRVRQMTADHGLKDYNYIRHDGFLRYTVIRTSRHTGETMIIFTTAKPDDEEGFKEFLALVHRETGVRSVWWTRSDGKADQSVAELFWHAGDDHIIDEIAGKRFMIRPGTFFQANTVMAGELFMRAAGFVEGNTLDLYCGVGVISIIVSGNASRVVGVEINEQSVATAKENAKLNGARCEFVAADAASWLSQSPERFDTVICDPARAGLGKDACRLLLSQEPKRIIYISCNPLTHKDDLAILQEKYEVKLLEGYDLFPQTPHIEMLSVLELKS
jgi:tRNA (uracil-5-)-methyltransferase